MLKKNTKNCIKHKRQKKNNYHSTIINQPYNDRFNNVSGVFV